MSLQGLRVLSLESRRAADMESLIRREGGEPFIAPSVKEDARPDDGTAIRFIEQLEAGEFDMVISMTGVGLQFLRERLPDERIAAALRRATMVARGPKPVAVLRALGVPVAVAVPEPNTWHEVVSAVAARPERRIAVQEYGRPNREMTRELEELGARVTPVALYRWELPDDRGPLQEAVRRIVAGEIDLVLFTSSAQLDHLLEVGRDLSLEGRLSQTLGGVAIASIGPVMTAALETHGWPPDIMPRHPKMWALVKAAAEEAPAVLRRKGRIVTDR